MNRWIYYTRLTVLDLLRLWPTVVPHTVIVAGICLPILILLGLKRGHVEELRKELLTSPTGREVRFSVALRGEFLTPEVLATLQSQLSGVEMIIPDVQRAVTLESLGHDGKPHKAETVTLYSTLPGDPFLKQLDADVLQENEHGLVLAQDILDELQLGPGDQVRLNVYRERSGKSESASAEFLIKGRIPKGTKTIRSRVGYLDLRVIDQLERYVQGARVPEFGWPAFNAVALDRYAAYLIFCRAGDTMQPEDFRTWTERGYTLEEVQDKQVRTLYGLLQESSLYELRVYRLRQTRFADDPRRRLRLDPDDEIAAITTPINDIVLPWNDPMQLNLLGSNHLTVGCSLPERNWLRKYFKPSGSAIPGQDEMRIGIAYDRDESILPSVPAVISGQSGTVRLDLSVAFNARTLQDARDLVSLIGIGAGCTEFSPASCALIGRVASEHRSKERTGASRTPIAVVPANLLAHLDAYRHGTVDFDSALGIFVSVPEPTSYQEARLYGETIDDVPAIVDELHQRQYGPTAQHARIREIHQQDASLQLLVVIVGLGVFIFGVITVITVLVDSTDRKRGTIGILRVMGVSRPGVFYLVFLRAALIGLLAGCLTIAFGYLLTWMLLWQPEATWIQSWKPQTNAVIRVTDVAIVFAGSLLCCICGSLFPAWRASRLNPFDAIVEGRFR